MKCEECPLKRHERGCEGSMAPHLCSSEKYRALFRKLAVMPTPPRAYAVAVDPLATPAERKSLKPRMALGQPQRCKDCAGKPASKLQVVISTTDKK